MKRSVCVVAMLLCAHLACAQESKDPLATLSFSTPSEASILAAARENNFPQLQEILKDPFSMGAVNGMDSVSNQLRTPLMYAAMHQNIPMVRALLEKGAKDSINRTDKLGNTALGYAVAFDAKNKNPQSRLEMINLLLDAGADINATYAVAEKNPVARGLLLLAVHRQDNQVVATLLKRGVKINYVDLLAARSDKRLDIFQMILKSKNMPWENFYDMRMTLLELRGPDDPAFPFVKAFLEAYQAAGRKASSLIRSRDPFADPGDYKYDSDIPTIYDYTIEGSKIRAYYDSLLAENK